MSKVDMFEKFTWKIENFSHLKDEELYSEPFILGGYPWRISLYPRGYEEVQDTDLSIYLEAIETANMSTGWSRDVKFKLIAFNQVNSNMTITEEEIHEYNASDEFWGFTSFMPLTEFRDPCNGFLVEDACIFAAEISVYKTTNENPISASPQSGSQTGRVEVEVTESDSQVPTLVCVEPNKHTDVELFSASVGELTDFRGFGQIEKAFLPLLEEVCSQHPSLIECQKKRSPKFSAWAFNALGRVLYFLKTRKVKDMNDLACKDLQTLWEELEIFRFDLAWLESHVRSALGMKQYVENTMQVEKSKEKVVALELEIEKLKAKLIRAKVDFEIARDLLKAKGGLEERDLDAELGYGKP